MKIAVCDDCRQDACAVRELLLGQEVKLYGSAESLLSDVEQGGKQFDLYVVQYLIKTIGREELEKLLDKVEKIFIKNKEKTLGYSWRRASGVIPYGKILYISSREHVLSIHCTDGRVQESIGKISDLEQQICGDTFLRCHQSFIVNVYHIREIAGMDLVLAEKGEKVPVSRRYYATVQERYRKLLFEEVGWE